MFEEIAPQQVFFNFKKPKSVKLFIKYKLNQIWFKVLFVHLNKKKTFN